MESIGAEIGKAADVETRAGGTEPVVNYGSELAAIKTIVSALQGLGINGRRRVLQYVVGLFGNQKTGLADSGNSDDLTGAGLDELRPSGGPADIRSLKEKKQPRSSVEMGVLVGYYLSELAPEEERSSTISQQDLQAYFKQAGYPVPAKPRNVLFHAAEAGYMTAVERGHYHRLQLCGSPYAHRGFWAEDSDDELNVPQETEHSQDRCVRQRTAR